MTKQQTAQVLSVLKLAYPAFYRGMSADETMQVVCLWHEMFAEDEYGAVNAAVKALIATQTEGYPPTIGAIKAKLADFVTLNAPDDAEAWAMVYKAICNGIYGYNTEFAKLPEDIKAAVGSPEQIRSWALMDTETVQSVVASNFKRSYRAKMQRSKELVKLPTDLKQLIVGIGTTNRLPEGTTDADT